MKKGKKLTYKQVKEIQRTYKEGKLSQRQIAKKMGITQETVLYHLNQEYRKHKTALVKASYNKLNKRQRRKNYEKRKEYMREYMRNQYQNNPDFRERQQERSRNYQRELSRKK